ncbi:MAG: DNA-binding MarR family transcriptional regulator [Paraglaciecola sp.]|jgi:DNA-binding MarR family transcriptional regulator
MAQHGNSMELLFKLSGVFSQVNKKVDRALSTHGISLSEFMVLHQLNSAQNQMMSRIELADAVNLSASGITRLITPLEKIHLVEKEKNNRDARVSLVKLTFSGRDLYKYAFLSCKHAMDGSTADLGSKQLTAVLDLLNKLQ